MTESGLLTAGQKNELAGVISSVLNHKNLSMFFGKEVQVMNEPEILDTDGKLYRPDRVILDRGKVSVLEYKTGRQRDEHVDQVKNYCRLLEEMDYPVENAFLVYLDHGPEMVRVV
jgi:CRISPR/Cas system-associated exonuclease Cas4 (RecB family)